MTEKIKILLGVTGGIAAYKSAEIARLLIKNDYLVKVVMTRTAEDFITPLTFETLTNDQVYKYNTAIKDLIIDNNDLTSIDVSANIFLELFFCQRNNLTSLDLSGNYFLQKIWCFDNQLTSLDIRNNNNQNIGTTFWDIDITGNYNLFCVDVDNPGWSMMNWTVGNDCIDSWNIFSSNCGNTSEINEITTNKELLKVTDLLGRETNQTNQPLFYIYDNGKVEKRITID